jgi:hypothetical protein
MTTLPPRQRIGRPLAANLVTDPSACIGRTAMLAPVPAASCKAYAHRHERAVRGRSGHLKVGSERLAATCLIELRQGPTGPGRGARRDALIAAARLRAWLSFGMRSCRAPPGEAVAQEGFAQLDVALPASLTPEHHRQSSARRGTRWTVL